jgi:hypothetical protein
MASIPNLSPPENLGAAIAPIANITEDEFNALRRAISTRRAFNVKPKAAKELANEIPALSATLPFTLSALNFLYARLEQYRDKVPLPAIVSQLVEDFEVACQPSDRQRLEQRLVLLLERNDSFDRAKKLQRLEKGFLPNAIAFRSFVDLRPDFGGDDNLQFGGFVKIVQFRIRTDGNTKKSRDFVFQINEEGLDELQDAVARAKAKLRALDELPTISLQIASRENT